MAQKFLTDIEVTRGLVDSSGDLGVAGQVLSSTGSGTNWITNEASSTVVYLDEFTGDNSTVDFTLSVSVTDENITQVYIDGVYQNKDTYSVSGATLTFSTAPPLNADIEVITFSTATTSDDLAAGSVIIPVKNTHTASIAKGEPVYITGNVGSSARLQIAPADASNSAKMPAAGLLLQTLAVNAEGYVITGGYLRNITTDTIDGTSTSPNDTVYVKSGGGLTMTKPTGTNLIQNVAKVARSHGANSGSLLVSSILRTNDVPNITNDYFWLGNSSGVATPTEFTSTARGLLSVGAEGTAAGDGNLAYNNSSGVFTYTPPVLGGLSGTTDDITEGSTNLYYTDARSRNAISVSGNAISYNSSTGVITSNYEENPTFTGNVTISGNLTVDGTQTILNTQTVEVEDNILQLNTTQGSPDTATATTSGISVYRGDGVTQASFIFDDADDTWDLTDSLFVANNIDTASDKRISVGTWDNSAFTGGSAYGFSVTSSLPLLHLTESDQTNKKGYVGLSGGSMYIGGLISNLYLQAGTSGATALTIDSSQNATFEGNVVSKDTFYLENGSGNRWQMLFDTNAFNLRYYNGSSWSADAFAIDTSNNATFAGDVGLGGTGLYTNTASLNIDGTGLAIKNDTAGSSNNWSIIKNTATSSTSNIVFVTGGGTSLTLNHDMSATFTGSGTFISDSTSARVLYLEAGSSNGNIIQFQRSSVNKWEVVGREGTFYIYKNDGTGSGMKWQIDTNGNHAISGNATFTTDVRSPIFYDSNNTGYYVDPTSTSNLSALNVGGSAVWTSGNDGSGSGLDADLLDGQHASAFASSSHTHAASDITSGNLAAARNTANLVNVGSSSDASGIYFRGTTELISGEGWCTAQYAFNENDGFLFLNRNSSSTAFPTFHIGGWNNAGYAGYSNADGLLTLTRSDGSKSTGSTYAGTGLSNTSYYTNIIKTTTKTVFRDAQSLHEFTGDVLMDHLNLGGATGDGGEDLKVGGIRGRFTNELIHLYNRVNIGYPNGWAGQSAPVYGLSVYGGVELATNTSYTTSGGSMRAPIFYDSNNTGYALDLNNNNNSAIIAGSVNCQNYNKAGLLVNASGTSSSGAAFGIQQVTSEGWTGIFVDFEPNTGWGLYHDNPNNYFCVTSEASTNNMRSFTVPSRSSGNRTAYEKIRFEQSTGHVLAGGDMFANTFYERTNTNYFIDPSLNSTIYNLQLGRSGNTPKFDMLFNDHASGPGWDTRIFIGRTDDHPNGTSFPTYTPTGGYGIQFQANSDGVFYGMKQYSSGNYRPFINWGDDGSDTPMEIAFNGTTKFTLSYDGINYATSSHRAPIFYDSDNTGYYVNPNATSKLAGLEFNFTQHGSANNIRMGNSTTMNAISSGTNNAAFGVEALGNCSTGSRNFAYGYAALFSLSSGSNNIAMGDACGYNVSSGSNNLLFGHNAGRTGYQSPQSIAGVSTASNQIHMGNESHTTARIQISWTVNSDARDKTDVTPIDVGLDFVNQLNPVTFRWDKRSDYEDRTPTGENKLEELTLGFLAQEVETVEKSYGYDVATKTNLVVDRDVEQDHFGITYEKMIPILTKAIQELTQEVQTLKDQINGIN